MLRRLWAALTGLENSINSFSGTIREADNHVREQLGLPAKPLRVEDVAALPAAEPANRLAAAETNGKRRVTAK